MDQRSIKRIVYGTIYRHDQEFVVSVFFSHNARLVLCFYPDKSAGFSRVLCGETGRCLFHVTKFLNMPLCSPECRFIADTFSYKHLEGVYKRMFMSVFDRFL